MSTSDVLAPWRGQEYVPLPDLARAVGMPKHIVQYARQNKIIVPAERRGPNGRHLVTWEQALLIVAAAALAAAAGIAIVTAIYALKNAGARVTDSAVVIPLGAAA